MASNFQNKTGNNLIWQSVIEYLLTTDRVIGDPADIVGAVGGKINVVLQQLIDNINWLRENGLKESAVQSLINSAISGLITESRANQLINNALVSGTTSRKGIVELATREEGVARSKADVVITPDAMDAALDALPIAPAGNLPAFQNNFSQTLNFTSDRIGNFGIFKITVNRSISSVRIISTSWVPINQNNIVFYNDSENRFDEIDSSGFDWQTGGSYFSTSVNLSVNDILYVLLLKVR